MNARGARSDPLPDETRAVLGGRDVFADQKVATQLPTPTSDWFRSLLASDPAADRSRVRVPVLKLFGGRDVQVPVGPDERALREAQEQAGKPSVAP